MLTIPEQYDTCLYLPADTREGAVTPCYFSESYMVPALLEMNCG